MDSMRVSSGAVYRRSQGVAFIDLRERHCKWPLEGQKPGPRMMCCGADRISPDKPYCAEHMEIATMPTERRVKGAGDDISVRVKEPKYAEAEPDVLELMGEDE